MKKEITIKLSLEIDDSEKEHATDKCIINDLTIGVESCCLSYHINDIAVS